MTSSSHNSCSKYSILEATKHRGKIILLITYVGKLLSQIDIRCIMHVFCCGGCYDSICTQLHNYVVLYFYYAPTYGQSGTERLPGSDQGWALQLFAGTDECCDAQELLHFEQFQRETNLYIQRCIKICTQERIICGNLWIIYISYSVSIMRPAHL